ncbi:MAG: hypothetical protein KatS3mg031_1460 [Chitinophagales bacterium]|nr:MAG: hypothetical protein KatS3mg031_1460 [Chitinophagales bacterium]
MTQQTLINRVEQSGIITLNLADHFPKEIIESLDLRQFLVQDQVLMEKPYREALKSFDWSRFTGKIAAIHCSKDTLIPMWAYMLAASCLLPHAKRVLCATPEEAELQLLLENIQQMDASYFSGTRVVIKGCGHKPIPPQAYVAITAKLQPVVQSLMYGEPCSAVPVYKKPKSS